MPYPKQPLSLTIVNTTALALIGVVFGFVSHSAAQGGIPNAPPQASQPLNVNWLYGAYVPKGVPFTSLTNRDRLRLYQRQTFTTPGIYVKTALFSIGDQIGNSPPGWGTGLDGYVRRLGSRQAQFVLQNSFASFGNAALGYEPRYDRCNCSGPWRRIAHAVKRNFVTYGRSESSLRPQVALYSAAFAAGTIAGTWKPHSPDLVAEGYQSVLTQAGFGTMANLVGEFAADFVRTVRGSKTSANKNPLVLSPPSTR